MKRSLLLLIILACCTSNAISQKVTLDYYFNHETRVDENGKLRRYHYLWTDTTNTGFSILGSSFIKSGVLLDTLNEAPNAVNLKQTAVYIIVDPDNCKENPSPHYIRESDITVVTKWVRNGGVLLMLANDSANVELPQFNRLAAKFGMHFNNDLHNHVLNDQHFEDGAISTTGNPLFKTAAKIFMKDVCSISVSRPAIPLLKNSKGAIVIASARYGKGTVLAVGDPWLYNEYTNGRLPKDFENDKAADDLVAWLIKHIKRK